MGRGKKKENGIKKYICYVLTRSLLINKGFIRVTENQANYYSELSKKITEYRKSHQLFFDYIVEKKSGEDMRAIVGKDRFPKWEKKERDFLINFITDWELRLFAVYPFEDKKVKER